MAESHIPFPYAVDQVAAIRASLSEPRFRTYLLKAGFNERHALALYLYNARLAKAFLFPLHVVEVSIRNGMDAMLAYRFGEDWHLDAALRASLFTVESKRSLLKAIDRVADQTDRNAVVAELTFDFWSNLLRSDYAGLWRANLGMVFPNVPRGFDRGDAQSLVREVNRLRNRVAHHEPILDVNIQAVLGGIYKLLGLRCAATEEWVRHHTTVPVVLRSYPKANGAASYDLGSLIAPEFLTVTSATPLLTVIEGLNRKTRTAVCVDVEGKPVAALTAVDLTRFICIDAKRNGGLFAPAERTVGDLLSVVDAERRWASLSVEATIVDAIARLRGKLTDVLIGVDPGSGGPVGTIQRAHRRY